MRRTLLATHVILVTAALVGCHQQHVHVVVPPGGGQGNCVAGPPGAYGPMQYGGMPHGAMPYGGMSNGALGYGPYGAGQCGAGPYGPMGPGGMPPGGMYGGPPCQSQVRGCPPGSYGPNGGQGPMCNAHPNCQARPTYPQGQDGASPNCRAVPNCRAEPNCRAVPNDRVAPQSKEPQCDAEAFGPPPLARSSRRQTPPGCAQGDAGSGDCADDEADDCARPAPMPPASQPRRLRYHQELTPLDGCAGKPPANDLPDPEPVPAKPAKKPATPGPNGKTEDKKSEDKKPDEKKSGEKKAASRELIESSLNRPRPVRSTQRASTAVESQVVTNAPQAIGSQTVLRKVTRLPAQAAENGTLHDVSSRRAQETATPVEPTEAESSEPQRAADEDMATAEATDVSGE